MRAAFFSCTEVSAATTTRPTWSGTRGAGRMRGYGSLCAWCLAADHWLPCPRSSGLQPSGLATCVRPAW